MTSSKGTSFKKNLDISVMDNMDIIMEKKSQSTSIAQWHCVCSLLEQYFNIRDNMYICIYKYKLV